ncbi:MAG: LamG domain-containing protein [Acidobacteriota bacterium]
MFRRLHKALASAFVLLVFLAAPLSAKPGLDGDLEWSPGPGYCDFQGQFCDSSGCLPDSDPLSQLACECQLLDPGCGVGSCTRGGSWIDGASCSAPVAWLPSSTVSLLMCGGAGGLPGGYGLSSSCEAITCAPAPAAPRVWWSLDEVPTSPRFVADMVGLNYGIEMGGVIQDSGRVDEALRFSSVTDSVVAAFRDGPTHGHLNLTVSAWIKPQLSGLLSPDQTILYWGGTAPGTASYRLFLQGDRLAFQTSVQNGIVPNVVTATAQTPPGAVAGDRWNHVTAVVDQMAQEVRLFVDAVPLATVSSFFGTSLPPWVAKEWRIGLDGQNGSGFRGKIDEVMVFETPLTPGQVFGIYDSGSAGLCKPSNPAIP